MIPPGDPAVAPLVGGRYQVLGLIASGGMGDVYEARDTVLERPVALKLLRRDLGRDPDFLARFRTEATHAARLAHPNIVQVYDFGQDTDGASYMALEYVDGQNLHELLGERGPLPAGAAARIVLQVCDALEHAHRSGIVHRDIKPENILVSADGRVKLADLGVSRALAAARATQEGAVVGSPHYLAPEQVEGSPADHRADIYALGIVFFEMLTGRTPFTGDTPAAIAYQRVGQAVPSPRSINPSVPEALDEVIATATSRAPEDRYRSAAAMARAIEASLAADDERLDGLARHTAVLPLTGRDTIEIAAARRTPPEPVALPPVAGTRARSRRRRRVTALLVVLALIGASIPFVLAAFARVDVPRVAGMPRDDAVRAIRDAGLVSAVDLVNHESIARNRVIETKPPPGASIRKGSAVTVIVSLGPVMVDVPNVEGASESNARATLRRAGFRVKATRAFSSTVAKGLVISQDPDPSVFVRDGSVVTITVSLGVEMFAVPDVRKKTEQAARDILTNAGFDVSVGHRPDDKVPEGVVIEQSPAAGSRREKGSTVALVVSSGPPKVTVPDIDCKTRKQAADIVASAGLEIEFVGNGKMVVDQDPPAGEKAARGSTVTAYTGPGGSCGR